MPARSATLRAYLMLGLTMLFWAGNSIVGRAVRDDIPPFTLAFGRWSLAMLLLAPFALRHVRADWPRVRRHWRVVLGLGLVGVAAFNGLLYSGLHYTSATNGLLLQALIPTLVLLLGRLLFRDALTWGQAGAVLLSTLGVALIVFRGEPAAILRLHLGLGDGLILCACLAWAIYTVCLRLRPDIHPLSFTFLTFGIGAIVMGALALTEAGAIATMRFGTPVIAAVVYVAVLPSICAYLLYNSAVALIGSSAASQTISLMPIFGAGLAAVLLGEALAPYHAVGMLLIAAGILLTWLVGSSAHPVASSNR